MLKYRIAAPGDRPAIERLWEDTDWGRLTPEMWDQWYESPVRGPSTVWLAIDDATGGIVGQFPFLPAFVWARGRQLKAHRAVAPIMAKGVRWPAVSTMREHPIVLMYYQAVEELKGRGEALVYLLPDPHWAHMLRKSQPNTMASFPFWSIPIPLAQPFRLDPDYTADSLDPGDKRIDGLCHRALQAEECMVMRTAGAIERRARKGYLLGIERAGELVGLVVSSHGWTQWNICDVLTVDRQDTLRAALMAVCNLAHENRELRCAEASDKELKSAGLLMTPALEPVAHGLGFRPDDYRFTLAVRRLDESVPWEEIAPERWYCSQND